MTGNLSFYWQVPTSGDGPQLIGGRGPQRRGDLDYLLHIACVAEELGFDGVMLPTGVATEDGALLAAALAARTDRLKLMVSFRAGPELPAHFAQRIATLQQLCGPRIQVCLFNGFETEQQSYGDFIEHDEAYRRADEFLSIATALWRGEPVQHASPHYLLDRRDGGRSLDMQPEVFAFGASDAASDLVARHADVHMMWAEPPTLVAQRVQRTLALATQGGRELRLGLRVAILARETEDEAWEEAGRLLAGIPDGAIEQAQREFGRSGSVGLARIRALHRQGRLRGLRELEVSPNLWAGSALVRGTTTLVGSYEHVAERLAEYAALGLRSFVLSGVPNLDALRRVGEQVLPRLSRYSQKEIVVPLPAVDAYIATQGVVP
ncbi:LLM class flavin-dependent oxidoreductase [Paucibacter sp. R3-3]|uniref:LLM class flavin-dependent oxidoreductase n=1 Tax=Roseateles agri TaxID=3098619 RepID=A0ABU5DMZ6_9BURK|nr:LLM class flavin-dependent oxidoreductase [Paucibacter sp. R3-3]MDY0747658.1 LLM class flavin-dependent oxidoreductase [Paucibacter sp. R3-3]